MNNGATEQKHKIMMVPFIQFSIKNYIEKSDFLIRGTKTLSFCPSSHSAPRLNILLFPFSKKRGTYILDCSALNQWEKDNVTPPFSRKIFDEKVQLDKKTFTMLQQDQHPVLGTGTGNNVTRVSLGENGVATTTESNGSSAGNSNC